MVRSKFELYGTLDLVEKFSCVPYSSFHQLCKPIPRENPKTKTSKGVIFLLNNAGTSHITKSSTRRELSLEQNAAYFAVVNLPNENST